MKEIKLLEEAKKESGRIGQVINEVSSREVKYKEKLAGLIKELPDMLARMALGEGITRSEVDDLEESINLLKERILEIPITLKGIKGWRLRAEHQAGKIIRQIETLYRSTKSKLSKGDKSPALVEQLKAYAPYIGMVEDCEEFFRKIKQIK